MNLLKTTFLLLAFLFLHHATAQIVNIEDKRAEFGDSVAWHETAFAGIRWTKNNNTVFSVNGGMQLEFRYKERSFLSISKVSYIKAGGKNYVNDGFQHLRYNKRVKPWLTYEAFAQIQYNEKLLLRLRALAGTGYRFRLFEKGKKRIHFGTAYMFEYDEESVNDITRKDHRWSNYLSIRLPIEGGAKFVSTTYYQPLFNNFGDFRLSSQSTVIFTLLKNLKFNATFSIIYDSKVPEGAPKMLQNLVSGVRYNF